MVRTRVATKRIESGQALPQDTLVVPCPSKKRRVDGAASPRKRHRGKPGELCQLNLDVLFLLAEYLHPLDLLNLARTSKSLRELLMDKASAFIWKTARSQVPGLPGCPADLTEPEYANLVFYARCHGCGKYTKKVFWRIRRRYCPECRRERLCPPSSCPDVVRGYYVLPGENISMDGKKGKWVDKEQLEAFMHGYNLSSEKHQFLYDKQNEYLTITQHASKCNDWEDGLVSERKFNLELFRQERAQNILERLKQHGYEPEITYFGHRAIQQSRKSWFIASKPLTDQAWMWMLPGWLETMNNFRSERLEKTVYRPRQDLLAVKYDNYVESLPPDAPALDLLPHVTELARFPPFRDIVNAPEGAQTSSESFEPAFAQLPALVDEWKEQLDMELAGLVRVPPHLSRKGDFSGGPAAASSNAERTESSQSPTDRLRLACAMFDTGKTVGCYPDVFFSMHPNLASSNQDSECALSIQDRFNMKFLEDAPYIVHACGLDPNIATVEEMDRRNARLKCLLCNDSYVRTWRGSLWHARHLHQTSSSSRSMSPHWQAVSDEYIDAIQAAEGSFQQEPHLLSTRCLLCRPCVGDVRHQSEIMYHLILSHGIEWSDTKQGVHYMPVNMRDICYPVEMIEEGGKVTFRA